MSIRLPRFHRPEEPGFWSGCLRASLAVFLATLVGHGLRRLDPADIVMVYLLAIVAVAARYGRWPSLLASILSVAAFDFFFVPPYFTFAVSDFRHIGTFAILLLVGIVVGTLTDRLRQQAQLAQAREQRTEALYRLSRELVEQRAQVQQDMDREQMRNALLSSVSHDLRTPLGSITGAASALLDGGDQMEAPVRRDLLLAIQEEAQRLHRLVTNLLDLTRLESGALEVHKAWTPLEEVVGSALNRMDPALSTERVAVEIPEDLPLAPLDEVLFEQVLINLLENAAKYAPADSPITLRAWSTGRSIQVAVADRGPGIPEGEEDRIFEKLTRGRAADGTQGAGLGLAICRGIVAAHGGRIEALNRRQGGAKFLITLPLEAAPPEPPQEAS